MKSLLILCLSLTLAACTAPIGSDGTTRKQPQTLPPAALPQVPLPQSDLDLFAIAFLDSIQAASIAERREFCGYFFRDNTGRIQGTPPRAGTFASCNMPAPRQGSGVIGSYHTHGAYGPRFDNEVPSVTDIQSDVQLGLNGYVSTPGGRVWRVNHLTRDTEQLCGLGCVTRDPGFVPRNESSVLARFTLMQLAIRTGV